MPYVKNINVNNSFIDCELQACMIEVIDRKPGKYVDLRIEVGDWVFICVDAFPSFTIWRRIK